MLQNLEVAIRVAELGAIVWGVFRGVTEIGEIRRVVSDFPLHRHINGKIIYPKGFEPTETESIASMTNGD